MANPLAQAAQIAANTARFSWYYGVNQLLDERVRRLGGARPHQASSPVPSRQALLADVARLLRSDARAVAAGVAPPASGDGGSILDHAARLRLMFADLPATVRRRLESDAGTARGRPEAHGLPDYFTQDFHFQTGGYLSAESARLYDVQVETLFYGTANIMRRAALRPMAAFMRGRDQRHTTMLDVACGTGRLLRQIRLAYPAMQLTGLDLSTPYLAEARRHLGNLRPAKLVAGDAEALPFADASFDIVTVVFLFHELPGQVRRRATAEIARVLKPGGRLIFIDSLQRGDRPDWDGLLEAFPQRFHEPFYEHYSTDDLDRVFDDCGLARVSSEPVFLSKLVVRCKT